MSATLSIDIGGTGIKMLVLDAAGEPLGERTRELTPDPAVPEAVFELISAMLAKQPSFDRISIGFPGVVKAGVAMNAPNLGDALWSGIELQQIAQERWGKPTRVLNDADLLGFGVIREQDVEMVLTLGTGLGSAVFTEGHLVPNLELGHHPFGNGGTYEEWVSDAVLKKVGAETWTERVLEVVAQTERIWNYDHLHLGGGNRRHLKQELPANVTIFTNEQGLRGGIKVWE